MDFLYKKSNTINDKHFKVIKSEAEFLMDTNMDTCPVEFMSDEWPSSPDDFFESILNLNSDDLLNDLHNDGMQNNNINLNNNVDAINEIATSLMKSSERVLSPPTAASELEFNQYFTTSNGITDNDTTILNDDVDMKNMSLCINNNFNEIKCENNVSSSGSSDSGLSSDHLDLDMSPDYEPLSPTLSSPGPSISERGGQNSPPRYIRIKQHQQPLKQQQQHQQQILNLQNSIIKNTNNSVKLSKPKVIVEKIQSPDGGLMFNKELGHIQIQPQNIQITKNLSSTKEVKIYRMAPANNMNNINYIKATNHGFNNGICNQNNNKKVTIQLKNSNLLKQQQQSSPVGGSSNGAVVINKKNLNGVRKLIRVQTPSNPRSILLPVSIPDVRTIKIINASNLKSKSPNIKLAAANLLQQSKQGLVQKNVLVTKEQLIEEFSDHNTSDDCESYVFEEVMQQSNTMLTTASHGKTESKQNSRKMHDEDDDDDDDIDYDDDDNDNDINQQRDINHTGSYPKLLLTNEEKRLLVKEGIALPQNYPLTKHEERELKRIRRKIRNKISAQDSRKRKKEYVDGLEERVKQCTEENQTLLKRIKILQSQNHNLMSQMKKLQTLLTKGTNKTTQPATCLMVLLLSMALVAVPNLKLGQNAIKESDLADVVEESLLNVNQQSVRRNLLYNSNDGLSSSALEEEMNIDDILSFNEHDYINEENSYVLSSGGPSSIKRSKHLVDYDVDDTIWKPNHNICFGTNSKLNANAEYEKQAKEYQENIKKIQSSGFNIENKKNHNNNNNYHVNNILNNLNDVVKINNDFLYELQLDDELKKNIINKNDGTVIDLNLVKNENLINDKIKKINSTQQRNNINNNNNNNDNNNKNINDNNSRIKITV